MTLDAYADLDQFRLYLRAAAVLDEGDDPDSALEALALEAAARAIDRSCNREFRVAGVATDRYFTPTVVVASSFYTTTPLDRHYLLPIDDVANPAGLTVAFDSTGNGDYDISITGFRVGPANAPARGRPYSQVLFDQGVYPPLWEESVKVNATWGWAAVPPTIVNANLLQAGRFIKRRDALFGVAGSPEMGNQMRLLARVDPDVAVMVATYKKNWGAV